MALPMGVGKALGGINLDALLLARHRIIDALLEDLIDGGVSQVVEVACGMSPRGWRFSERYGDRLLYIEADLPAMAQRKREALARIGPASDRHRVVDLDALRDGGPGSIEALAETLDPTQGLVIITEGLLTYLDDDTVDALWARLAKLLGEFSNGAYLSDLRFARRDRGVPERTFEVILSAFVRGKVHAYRGDEATATAALRSAGFEEAHLHRGDEHPAAGDARREAGAGVICVIEAVAANSPAKGL
jgi:O-methyltransferase involved in polyketide biosynthesis